MSSSEETKPALQEFMRAHRSKDGAALQATFTAKIQNIVAGHKKIMEDGTKYCSPIPPKMLSFNPGAGKNSLAVAARSGFRGVASAGYYID